MKFTSKQTTIARYLSKCDMPQTPTEIGQACGRPYHSASSWANSGLKSLVAAGLIERSPGAYYWLTDAGFEALRTSQDKGEPTNG